MDNRYWPVYQRLEQEFLNFAHMIHIDDEQLSVYSTSIADLLIKVVVQIEALSKELFVREGGDKKQYSRFYFDKPCLKKLNEKWNLGDKVVLISCPFLYLEDPSKKCFTPLDQSWEKGADASAWKQAYQAVKHDRGNSLKEGNFENVLHALGACFLLNLYYYDLELSLGKDDKARGFDEHLGSSIFSVKIHPFSGYINPGYTEDDAVDECVYLIRITDESKARIQYGLQRLNSTLQSPGLASALPPRINLTQDQFNRIDDFRQKIKELDTPSSPYVATPGEYMAISTDWIKDMLQGILDGIEYEVVTNKGQYKKHPM